METYNEQQLSMCETKDLVEYISQLRVEIDDFKEKTYLQAQEEFNDWVLKYNKVKGENRKLKEKNVCLRVENDELKQLEAEVTDALWDESIPDVNINLVCNDIQKIRKENEKMQETIEYLKQISVDE